VKPVVFVPDKTKGEAAVKISFGDDFGKAAANYFRIIEAREQGQISSFETTDKTSQTPPSSAR
jgi:hypothetical protein